MLDKSIPYFGVLMIKDNPAEYPEYYLPPNYTFCMYKKGDEVFWAELKVLVGEFNNKSEAMESFRKEFMGKPKELAKRCIFVKSIDGEIVATSSLWSGNHFGANPMQRIHWVSVSPKHQGKGVAKALITKTLALCHELGSTDTIYLTTQTWSYKAINMYLSFGFKPYKGEKPVNLVYKGKDFASKNREAWDLIQKKIFNYTATSKHNQES
jgi:GNAT superfamily N-acetyltransferase